MAAIPGGGWLQESVRALTDAGPRGLLAQPQLLFDVIVRMATALGTGPDSLRGQVDGLTRQVSDLVEFCSAQAEQLRHARQGLSMLHDAQQEVKRRTEQADALSARVTTVEGQAQRLERLHDILAERVGVNAALVESVRPAASPPSDPLSGEAARLTVTEHRVAALTQKADELAARTEELAREAAAAETRREDLAKLTDARATSAQQEVDTVRRDVRRQEKRLVQAVEDLARRLRSEVELGAGERTAAQRTSRDEISALAARVEVIRERCDSVQERKVDFEALNGLFGRHLRECAVAWGDEVENLYRIFELRKEDTRRAAAGSRHDRVSALHSCPAFASVLHAVQTLSASVSQLTAGTSRPATTTPRHRASAVEWPGVHGAVL